MLYDSNGRPTASRYRMSIFDWLVILAVAEVAFFASCVPAHSQTSPLHPACPAPHGPWGRSQVVPSLHAVVCLTDHDTPGKYELWSAPLADGAPIRLSPPMPDDRDVIRFAVSPTGDRVAYTADPAKWTQYELFSVATVSGLLNTKLSGTMPSDHDVDDFIWNATGSRVLYRKGRNATNDWVLWSSTALGSTNTRLSLVGQEVQPGFTLLYGDRVRYTVLDKGYVTGVTGGTVLAEIFADGFNAGNMEAWR